MKTFKLFSMAALALAMAACSNEDSALENAVPAQQQGAMKFTATLAAPGSGATTRTTYTEVTEGADAGKIKVAWKAGDEISLYDEDGGATCTATVGTPAGDGSATISGTFDQQVEVGHNITATYPASAVIDGFNAKFASQAGTIAYIQDNLDYRIGTSTISVEGTDATLATALQMESQIAIWKLTLQNSSSGALSATKVTIKNGSTVIAATTDITATSAVYLALNLENGNISGADITIEATVGSDTYTYSASGVSLAKGNYYQSTVKMDPTVTLTPAQIGDLSGGDKKTIGDITIELTGDAHFTNYGTTGLMSVYGYPDDPEADPSSFSTVGSFTFTSSAGKIKRIDINHDTGSWNGAGAGWPGSYDTYDNSTFTWRGTPDASVTLNGSFDWEHNCTIYYFTSIVFTLE